MNPYVMLIAYTFVIVAIAVRWGVYMERNRQAEIRKASIRTRIFQPSTQDITFN